MIPFIDVVRILPLMPIFENSYEEERKDENYLVNIVILFL
jgi:hypothetical protein